VWSNGKQAKITGKITGKECTTKINEGLKPLEGVPIAIIDKVVPSQAFSRQRPFESRKHVQIWRWVPLKVTRIGRVLRFHDDGCLSTKSSAFEVRVLRRRSAYPDLSSSDHPPINAVEPRVIHNIPRPSLQIPEPLRSVRHEQPLDEVARHRVYVNREDDLARKDLFVYGQRII
jgi:hypothetical protein